MNHKLYPSSAGWVRQEEQQQQTYVGVAVSVAGLALAAYSAANQPKPPDLVASSQEIVRARGKLLPLQKKMEAAAQSGQDLRISNDDAPYDEDTATFWSALADSGLLTQNADGSYNLSFKGYGEADAKGKIAAATAKNNLELAKKYDSQFIDVAKEQLKQADPEGYAARQKQFELTKEFAGKDMSNPISDKLERQAGDQLKAGKGLDSFDQETLNRAVADAEASRGGRGTSADFAEPLTTGQAGEQRRMAGIQKATGFLSSGQTPEDKRYKQEQEAMALLSDFSSGKTPTSQFGTLRNANTGPTPTVNGQPGSLIPSGNTGAAGAAAVSHYGQQLNKPNDWFQGVMQAINAYQTNKATG